MGAVADAGAGVGVGSGVGFGVAFDVGACVGSEVDSAVASIAALGGVTARGATTNHTPAAASSAMTVQNQRISGGLRPSVRASRG